ncbi:hypothetical protein [Serratia marcescens]|uniref:hypothetical protein n=1 Tax=Serratia marcescens TaxID=615 RepID=UPI0018D925FC|nr:hypothetical protein [Serratia marcescens]MBK5605404.1 hypothetical protein [Serratia marcescens]
MSNQFGGLGSLSTPAPYNLPTSLSSGLGLGVIKMPEIKNVWYNNQDLKIDGWRFVSCRMDNCRLYVSSGNFVFENCFIDEGTIVHFQNDSLKVIQLMNRSNEWLKANYPQFSARTNPDGTISIGA